MKLTASLILRNELHRYLEPCVHSLLEFCDEIRVLDDSSTDRWEAVIRSGLSRSDRERLVVHNHHVDTRPGAPAFHLHAAARNRLLEFTLAGDPTYVLAVDADEFVTDGAAVRRACEKGGSVLTLEIAEVWEACDDLLCVREDGGWRSHEIGCVWRADRFRAGTAGLTDKGHATGRVPDAVHRVASTPTGESLLHFGWTNLAERAERFERYAVGDAGKFHAAAHIQSIMWPTERVTLSARKWPASWSSSLVHAVRDRSRRA